MLKFFLFDSFVVRVQHQNFKTLKNAYETHSLHSLKYTLIQI